jgi:hypothetical protein
MASGPTSLVNRSRSPNGAGEVSQLVSDYTTPILKPQAAEVVKKYGEMSLAGVTYPNPRNQCWPGGVPYVFTNLGMQMIQQPDKITILYSDDHEVRRVRMNWSATVTYRRPLGEWAEVVCAENPYEFTRKVAVPAADKPDF